jgi:hypothetical protein
VRASQRIAGPLPKISDQVSIHVRRTYGVSALDDFHIVSLDPDGEDLLQLLQGEVRPCQARRALMRMTAAMCKGEKIEGYHRSG